MTSKLSASGTYDYKLAKWLDEKLKPLFVNDHTINDIFLFANELHEMEINEHDPLGSYEVFSLLTNIPVDKTFESTAERTFENSWFNEVVFDRAIANCDQISALSI